MTILDEKFKALEVENAPGQEIRQSLRNVEKFMRGSKLEGALVDFSHGDVDAFPPTPNSDIIWKEGFKKGAQQAYTEYRGSSKTRNGLADCITDYTGSKICSNTELIITPGTQGALFLALGATVSIGTKVAVVEPDYFANRKLVHFFGGEVVPISLKYNEPFNNRGLDLNQLEDAFKNGTKVLVFSTPNNPTGLVYSHSIIAQIASLSSTYNVAVIVDQLYARMLFKGEKYTHLCSCNVKPNNLITIMGPSKTESLSGYRLGVAFGTSNLIDRMERLQAIVSLRASGYNQSVMDTWFKEPLGWLENRISEHEAIRNELLKLFRKANIETTTPQAGSYLFPRMPKLSVDLHTFVRLLQYQANVIVTPGTEFAPSCSSNIRLNFSQDYKAAIAATKRIVKMVELYSL